MRDVPGDPMRLRFLADNRLKLFIWCNGCSHNACVDVRPILLRLGPDFAVPHVGKRMRCSRCGGREIETRPDWTTYGAPTSPISRHA